MSRCFFPESRGAILELDNGINAAVVIGAPGYQLSSGEIITL